MGWLVTRHWVLETNTSPSLHFGWWATDPDARYQMLISRDKVDSGILAFTAKVPLEANWLEPLNAMGKSAQQILIQEMGVFIAAMQMGFDGLEWPLLNLAVQSALPINNNLSEHDVDVRAKAMIHAIQGARSIIPKAIIESTGDTQGGQRE